MPKIEINFGVSEFELRHPENGTASIKERICQIGDIDRICKYHRDFSIDLKPIPYLEYIDGRVAMILPRIIECTDHPYTINSPRNTDLYLIWINEKHIWLAFEHSSWEESCDRTIDEEEKGPFRINHHCAHILCDMFCRLSNQYYINKLGFSNPSVHARVA
jgi:hypothetical protein